MFLERNVGVTIKDTTLLATMKTIERPRPSSQLAQDHFMSKPSTIVQQLKVNTRSKQPGETTVMFLAGLRRLKLDEMLRDLLECWVHNIRIQHWLLAEPKLTLKRALDLALSDKDALDRDKGDSQEEDAPVNKVDPKVDKIRE